MKNQKKRQNSNNKSVDITPEQEEKSSYDLLLESFGSKKEPENNKKRKNPESEPSLSIKSKKEKKEKRAKEKEKENTKKQKLGNFLLISLEYILTFS
jgi:hypothetical protein